MLRPLAYALVVAVVFNIPLLPYTVSMWWA
jgi:hypothetical protein